MNPQSALLQQIFDNLFLNTIFTLPHIIPAACQRVLDPRIDTVVREDTGDEFTVDFTANGQTTAITFKTEPTSNPNLRKIVKIVF